MDNKIQSKERRTGFVVVFTLLTMIAEISVGLFSHSMALFADGVHMGSHVLVIGLNWGAYVLVRHLERSRPESYDSGRILSLSAFASGIFLLLLAVFIVVEAAGRLSSGSGAIGSYPFALSVAGVGLVVNIVCAAILHGRKGDTDYNIHAAYLHILADALTEIGAIFGIVCAMVWGITWIDAVVAVASSAVVIRWAWRLLWDTGRALTRAA